MSDKKISDLVELTTLAADDVLPVVDSSANATKRITGANLSNFPSGVTVPDGSTIGSASDADAITIAAGGDVTFSQDIIASGDVTIDSDLQFNSGYGSAATAYGCRAWVNFDGTGTVAIRDSGNVSSITDVGVGQYDINFASTLVDANYSAVATTVAGGSGVSAHTDAYTTSSFRVVTFGASTFIDRAQIVVNVVR